LACFATQVRKGKNAMPSFSRLTESDIEDVANYVLAQAKKRLVKKIAQKIAGSVGFEPTLET